MGDRYPGNSCIEDISLGDRCLCLLDKCPGDRCKDDRCPNDLCLGDSCPGDRCQGDRCPGDMSRSAGSFTLNDAKVFPINFHSKASYELKLVPSFY